MPPSGSAAASVMSNPPMGFNRIVPGVGPPISQPSRLPFLSARPSAKARSVPLSLPALIMAIASMPRFATIALAPAGSGTVPGRRSEAVGGKGIERDAVLALERDIGGAVARVAVDQGHAFGVAHRIVAQRLAVGAEHRAEHRIAQTFEPPPVIIESGPEPGAGIGDGEQRAAGRVERERRIAAEMAGLGVEIEPGPEDQLAELLAARIIAVEVDGDGGDGGRRRPGQHRQRLVGERRRDREESSRRRDGQQPPGRARRCGGGGSR